MEEAVQNDNMHMPTLLQLLVWMWVGKGCPVRSLRQRSNTRTEREKHATKGQANFDPQRTLS